MRAGGEEDDTVRLRPGPSPGRPRRRARLWITVALGGAVLLAAGSTAAWRHFAAPPLLVAGEAEIVADQPCKITVFRFAPDPHILVIDFPDLHTQGLMLDRVAALVEKAGLPRDRVLDYTALCSAITRAGDTIDSYYYGHDYPTADLARFFALADQEGIRLDDQELWLKSLLGRLGWLAPDADGAIITLPAVGGPITPEMRAVILRHELSHGAFFTNQGFASYVAGFWSSLTAPQQAAFKEFLGKQGYDTTNDTLMMNETMAYLVFTRDPEFFTAAAAGLPEAEADALRARFIANMPDFWLRRLASAPLSLASNAPSCKRA